MSNATRVLPHLSRHWWTSGVPGRLTPPENYAPVELAAMPPVPDALGDDLAWLTSLPVYGRSIEEAPEGAPERPVTGEDLDRLLEGWKVTLPPAFERFVRDPEPRARIRSATLCYLELADYPVPTKDGGTMIHVLSDQQDVFHWLLYVAPDGGHAMVITPIPLGLLPESGKVPEGTLDLSTPGLPVVVCAETFTEFLYRYRIENEIWLTTNGLRADAPKLTDEERAYQAAYPTVEAVWGACRRRRPGSRPRARRAVG